MLLWTLFAIMACATVLLVGWPRRYGHVNTAANADIEFYRARLLEIERDTANGTLDAQVGQEQRAEVARMLLKASSREAAIPPPSGPAPFGMQIALLAVPIAAAGLYLSLGSPDAPGRSATERAAQAPAEQPIDALVARVEERLRVAPRDAAGWNVIAPVYLRLGRYSDAAAAYGQLIVLRGETADTLAGLAEATILSNGGLVNEAARAALDKALKLQPDNRRGRLWHAVQLEQDGQLAEARQAYEALRPDAGAEMRVAVDARLAAIRQREASVDAEQAGGAMTERLAQRLASEPNDVAGWLQLMRSYRVLGRAADAGRAVASARATFAVGSPERAQIDAAMLELGLTP